MARTRVRRLEPLPSAAMTRPFRVLGLQQVAIGGPDKQALRGLWIDLLGIPQVDSYFSERENVDEDILRLGLAPFDVEIDLMQAIDPEGTPKIGKPPLNHIALWIDDLPAAHAWLSEQGVRFAPGGIRKGAGGRDICFIHPRADDQHPRSGEGVLIELVQAPVELIAKL